MRASSPWFPIASALLAHAASTEALLVTPPGTVVPKHQRILDPHRRAATLATSTALFFKNATTESQDVDTISIDGAVGVAVANPTAEKDESASKQGLPGGAVSASSGFDENCFPGRDENSRFDCHPSVTMWRNFQAKEHSAQDNLQEMNRISQRFVNLAALSNLKGTASASYFGRHVARTAYFGVNAVLGVTAYQISKRSGGSSSNNNGDEKMVHATTRRGSLPMGLSGDVASRLVLEALLCYEQDYFEWIASGAYREPWDMKTLRHRQSNPVNVVTQTGRFVREAVGTLGRRSRGTEDDKKVKFFSGNASSARTTTTTKAQQRNELYPDYYQTAFHFQGDGWMSTDSANVYETSTETLFLGRQDSMQRTSLPPLVALAEKFSKDQNNAVEKRPMRVLEVACGTGRFMTFARDNLPLDTEYTALDLSPFYLEKASDNDDYWRETRQREEEETRGRRQRTTASATIPPAILVQAPAESLPFPDNSFDAVVCVYLFHELPRDIRARAAAEMARVVAPGGTVVLTDSVQKGDRPPLDQSLSNFQNMNEPFYIEYINDDLGKHFEKEGLEPRTKIVRSTTKSLAFTKPGGIGMS